MLFLLFIVGICALSWLYKSYTRLSRRGIKHGPYVPLLGDMAGVILQKEHITDVLMRAYEGFPGERIIGRYEFLTPYLIVKDTELLKRITVKDFEHFIDRNVAIDANAEPLFGRNLVSLKGDRWKEMRSALSPAFTSSKIRLMAPFMVQVADQMMTALQDKIKESEVDYIDLEAKDLMMRYTNKVIATCAFGLEVNSQHEENEFYKISEELTTLTFGTKMRFLGYAIVPWPMSALQLPIFPSKVSEFYSKVVLGTMNQREEQQIHRPDMIHLLMEAKKGKLLHDTNTETDKDIGRGKNKTDWSDMDLVAQAVIFLFAGYDTVSTTISFLLYELAVNPDYQERLLQEIRDNEKKNNGKFDYNSVQHMTYLDMVVSEVLRKWPGNAVMDRLCVRDYNLGKPNDQATENVIIRKGESVQIPIWAYHRDPKNYPEPEKFDPERFSEDNKHKIDPYLYMPFGLGPRNCIGSRFALCEIKVIAYILMLHMEVSPCKKTVIPIPLSVKDGFRMNAEGGIWLRLKPRKILA